MTTAPESESTHPRIRLFGPAADAPLVQDTDLLSMPVADPPAPEALRTWLHSGGSEVRVLFQDGDGMSLLWLRYAPGYPQRRNRRRTTCAFTGRVGET